MSKLKVRHQSRKLFLNLIFVSIGHSFRTIGMAQILLLSTEDDPLDNMPM